MKWKDIIFSVFAAVIPVAIYDLIKELAQPNAKKLLVAIIACVCSFVALMLLYVIFYYLINRQRLYCGQWVETLTDVQSPGNKLVALGIIRHDSKTNEYVFTGSSYTTDGDEECRWEINCLSQQKDNSMQYLCKVIIDNDTSVGELSFSNKNEFKGTIWIIRGTTYKIDAYRITYSLMTELDFHVPLYKRCRVRVSQRDYPDFARKYAARYLSK